MHHIAFELRSFEHHKNSSDKLAKQKIRPLWGPSRHTAGHNIAAYHHDPDQHYIELFSDLDVYIPELDCMDPRPWHENYLKTKSVGRLELLGYKLRSRFNWDCYERRRSNIG